MIRVLHDYFKLNLKPNSWENATCLVSRNYQKIPWVIYVSDKCNFAETYASSDYYIPRSQEKRDVKSLERFDAISRICSPNFVCCGCFSCAENTAQTTKLLQLLSTSFICPLEPAEAAASTTRKPYHATWLWYWTCLMIWMNYSSFIYPWWWLPCP